MTFREKMMWGSVTRDDPDLGMVFPGVYRGRWRGRVSMSAQRWAISSLP